MKGFKLGSRALLCLQSLFLFVGIGTIWYSCYYYSLLWLEGYSYFTSLPDLKSVLALFPDDAFKYAGAFLLQFFYNPLCGAAIQAGFATWIMICTGIIVIKLCRKPSEMLWLAFIPVPFYIFGQFWDLSLERSVIWCLSALGIMCFVCLISLWKQPAFTFYKWLRHPIIRILIPLVWHRNNINTVFCFPVREPKIHLC